MVKKSKFIVTPVAMLPAIIEGCILDGIELEDGTTLRDRVENYEDGEEWQSMVEIVSMGAAKEILEQFALKQR